MLKDQIIEIIEEVIVSTGTKILTIRQAAKKYGVSESAIRKWIQHGRIQLLYRSPGLGLFSLVDENSVAKVVGEHRLHPNKGGRPRKLSQTALITY